MKFLLAAALAIFALTQCTPPVDQSSGVDKKDEYLASYDTTLNPDGSFRSKGYWDDDGITGRPYIQISLDEQLAFFHKGSHLVGVSPISTGMGGYDTPMGTFRISQKKEKHRSTLYGVIKDKKTGEIVNNDVDTRITKPGSGQYYEGAPMNYFMRFAGAVGMHTGYIPGYPASHGCVRMPNHMAKKFFENAPVGTTVKVVY